MMFQNDPVILIFLFYIFKVFEFRFGQLPEVFLDEVTSYGNDGSKV
jgi:hypothetical protein